MCSHHQSEAERKKIQTKDFVLIHFVDIILNFQPVTEGLLEAYENKGVLTRPTTSLSSNTKAVCSHYQSETEKTTTSN